MVNPGVIIINEIKNLKIQKKLITNDHFCKLLILE